MTFKSFALILSVLAGFGVEAAHAAQRISPAEASKRIAQAVKAAQPLAESGVSVEKIAPGARTVRAAMFALASQNGDTEKEFEASWVGKDDKAWGADSSAWGEATMKDAYDYIMSVDRDYLDSLSAAERAKLNQRIAKAKEAFGLFVGTGVMFGVAPIGAVQCGVTFAALTIIDPHSGKIYVFRKEGSGC